LVIHRLESSPPCDTDVAMKDGLFEEIIDELNAGMELKTRYVFLTSTGAPVELLRDFVKSPNSGNAEWMEGRSVKGGRPIDETAPFCNGGSRKPGFNKHG